MARLIIIVVAVCLATGAGGCDGLVATKMGPVAAELEVPIDPGDPDRIIARSRAFAASTGMNFDSGQGKFGFQVMLNKDNLRIWGYNSHDPRLAYFSARARTGMLREDELALARQYLSIMKSDLANPAAAPVGSPRTAPQGSPPSGRGPQVSASTATSR